MGSTAGKQGGKRRQLLGLAGFLAACFAVSAIGGVVTATSVGSWYQELEKPAFNPPDWLFAPVWTTLYILMAIAGWRVWRCAPSAARTTALIMFAGQLCLNLAWSMLFFGLQLIGGALLEIVLLLLAIVVTTALFWRIDRPAAALLLPYALWVSYAALLNLSLWMLN